MTYIITQKNEHNYFSNGFTILEIMIVTAIVMALIATIFVMQNFLTQQQTTTFQSFVNVDNANQAVEQMVREIRNARYGDDGAYPLQICNDQNLTIYTNTDDDQATEKVQYYLDGEMLKKAVIQPSNYPIGYTSPATITIIADGVSNGVQPIFSYFDRNYTGAGNSINPTQRQLQTKLVKITINTNQLVNQDAGTDFTITAFAQIRMLKDNL